MAPFCEIVVGRWSLVVRATASVNNFAFAPSPNKKGATHGPRLRNFFLYLQNSKSGGAIRQGFTTLFHERLQSVKPDRVISAY
jgi:hypothetical protein